MQRCCAAYKNNYYAAQLHNKTSIIWACGPYNKSNNIGAQHLYCSAINIAAALFAPQIIMLQHSIIALKYAAQQHIKQYCCAELRSNITAKHSLQRII